MKAASKTALGTLATAFVFICVIKLTYNVACIQTNVSPWVCNHVHITRMFAHER